MLVLMSKQTTQPDATRLLLNPRNCPGEIKHQAILKRENHAHISPRCGIYINCSIQIALLLGALYKLTDKLIDSAVMLTETMCNIGITRFNDCLEKHALDIGIGFDCGTIVSNNMLKS